MGTRLRRPKISPSWTTRSFWAGRGKARGQGGGDYLDLVVLEEGADALGLGIGLRKDPDLIAGLEEGGELLLEILDIAKKGAGRLGTQAEAGPSLLVREGKAPDYPGIGSLKLAGSKKGGVLAGEREPP